jgi:O-antigen/teichoic acid export membrane protein
VILRFSSSTAQLSTFATLSLISSGVSAIKAATYAGMLGPEQFGFYSVFEIVSAIGLYAGTLGVLDGASRVAPILRGQGRADEAHDLMAQALGFQLFASALGCVVAGGVCLLAGRFDYRVVLLGLTTFATNSLTVASVVAASTGRFRELGLISASRSIGTAVLGASAAWSFGITGVLAAEFSIVAMISSWALWLSPFAIGASWPTRRTTALLFREGLPILLTNVSQFLLRNLERICVGIAVGVDALGQYSFGSLVLSAAVLVQGICLQFLTPTLAHRRGSGEPFAQALKRVDKYVIRILVGGLCGYALASAGLSVIERLVNGAYAEGLNLMHVLLLAAVFQVAQLYPAVFVSHGQSWRLLHRSMWAGIAGAVACAVGVSGRYDTHYFAWVAVGIRGLALVLQRADAWNADASRTITH